MVFVSISVNASAGTWMPAAKKIQHVLIDGDTAIVVIEGGVPSASIPGDCNSGYNTVLLTSDHGKAILSIALAARLSGQPVKLALSCDSSVSVRPFITHIQL